MMVREFLALQARTTPEENRALPRDVHAKGVRQSRFVRGGRKP